MRLTLCKLCQYMDRLASSGNPILVGLFSRMAVSEFPTRLDPSFLVVEIEVEPHETGRVYRSQLRLIDEDGHIMTSWNGEINLPLTHEPMAQRTLFSIPLPWDDGFEFRGPGAYRLDIVMFPDDEEEIVLGGETLLVHAGEPRI